MERAVEPVVPTLLLCLHRQAYLFLLLVVHRLSGGFELPRGLVDHLLPDRLQHVAKRRAQDDGGSCMMRQRLTKGG